MTSSGAVAVVNGDERPDVTDIPDAKAITRARVDNCVIVVVCVHEEVVRLAICTHNCHGHAYQQDTGLPRSRISKRHRTATVMQI